MKGAAGRAVAIAAGLAALLALSALATWVALPVWLEKRLVPELARRHGLDPVALDIRRIGLRGLDAADIHIGDAVRAAHLTADYRPGDLLRRRIRRLAVFGLTVNAAWDGRQLRLKGIDLPGLGGPQSASGAALPDAWIGRLEIRGGSLALDWGQTRIKLPFSLVAACPAGDLSRVDARLEIFPHRNPIRVMLQTDAQENVLTAVLQADDTPLERSEILLAREELRLGGRVSARAEARAAISPFKIHSLDVEATSADLAFKAPGIQGAAADRQPLRLSWRLTESDGRLAFDASGALDLARPLAAAVTDLRVEGALDRGVFAIQAGAALRLPAPWNGLLDITRLTASGRLDGEAGPSGELTLEVAGNIGGPLPLNLEALRIQASGGTSDMAAKGEFAAASGENFPLGALNLAPTGIQGAFSARLTNLARWQAALSAASTAPSLELAAGRHTVHIGRPEIHLELSGQKSALDIAARLTSGPGQLAPEGFGISWPKIEAEAHGTMDWSAPPTSGDLRFTVQFPRLNASSGQMEAQLRPIRLEGRLLPGTPPGVNAELRAAGRIVWPAGNLAAENIALHLPLQWPVVEPAAGTLALKLTPRAGLTPGRLEAALRQTDGGLAINGALRDLFFPGTDLRLAAAAALTPAGIQGRLDADLAAWSPAAPIDLGILAPAAAGLSADGKFTLHADLTSAAGRLESGAHIGLREGALTGAARQLRADGVQMDLHLVDLTTLRSAPGQVLRFARADLGSIRLSDGSVAFQVEAAHQALLEKGSFAWCGGRVYMEAMRFSPAEDDYQLTLFCDRLRLSELLDQVGGLTAEGGGTVSGRIPVHYRRGQLAFNDGFLFSSPGEGGKIRLADIERFTTAIDPQTLEAAQLALASEALKDYDYQWVKVGIDSQDELLALRLQFDGKPSRPLPFVYRQELGRFVRVEAPNPGSRFQGIGLDINLRLPLNRILEYGDLMKRLE